MYGTSKCAKILKEILSQVGNEKQRAKVSTILSEYNMSVKTYLKNSNHKNMLQLSFRIIDFLKKEAIEKVDNSLLNYKIKTYTKNVICVKNKEYLRKVLENVNS